MGNTQSRYVNILEKMDPSEIERTTILENSIHGFIESVREN